MSNPLIEVLHPPSWPRPRGYANAMIAEGRMIFVSGQVGWDSQGVFQCHDLVGQIRQALCNVLTILAEAGAGSQHVVRLNWYLADKDDYNARSKEIGQVYRELMGEHYPAMTAVAVAGFIENAALVEIEATAVCPQR